MFINDLTPTEQQSAGTSRFFNLKLLQISATSAYFYILFANYYTPKCIIRPLKKYKILTYFQIHIILGQGQYARSL